MWSLQRCSGAWYVAYPEMSALMGRACLCPDVVEGRQDFQESRQPLSFGHLKGPELEIPPSQRRGQHESAAADDIERGNLLCQFHRVMQWEQANHPQFHAWNIAGDS